VICDFIYINLSRLDYLQIKRSDWLIQYGTNSFSFGSPFPSQEVINKALPILFIQKQANSQEGRVQGSQLCTLNPLLAWPLWREFGVTLCAPRFLYAIPSWIYIMGSLVCTLFCLAWPLWRDFGVTSCAPRFSYAIPA